eukprot:scaffold8503_cov296-Pinguiococcus_pyrenoidosus.AAC.4
MNLDERGAGKIPRNDAPDWLRDVLLVRHRHCFHADVGAAPLLTEPLDHPFQLRSRHLRFRFPLARTAYPPEEFFVHRRSGLHDVVLHEVPAGDLRLRHGLSGELANLILRVLELTQRDQAGDQDHQELWPSPAEERWRRVLVAAELQRIPRRLYPLETRQGPRGERSRGCPASLRTAPAETMITKQSIDAVRT